MHLLLRRILFESHLLSAWMCVLIILHIIQCFVHFTIGLVLVHNLALGRIYAWWVVRKPIIRKCGVSVLDWGFRDTFLRLTGLSNHLMLTELSMARLLWWVLLSACTILLCQGHFVLLNGLQSLLLLILIANCGLKRIVILWKHGVVARGVCLINLLLRSKISDVLSLQGSSRIRI